MKRYLLAVFLWLLATPAYSWTNGDLLIWMDAERGRSLEAITQKFRDQFAINVVDAGILPKSISYSATEELMSAGKLAMMISGPWAWANLMKCGIDFGIAPVPGCGGNPAKPFVGVMACYINTRFGSPDRHKQADTCPSGTAGSRRQHFRKQ